MNGWMDERVSPKSMATVAWSTVKADPFALLQPDTQYIEDLEVLSCMQAFSKPKYATLAQLKEPKLDKEMLAVSLFVCKDSQKWASKQFFHHDRLQSGSPWSL